MVSGEIDISYFGRGLWGQVLHFINALAWELKFKEKGSLLKIERMIQEMPSQTVMTEQVKDWINANWDKY